jgi:nitronate monooxygenase
MGVGVSGWILAREVASRGQLGVVSGTALDTILIRRLSLGDPGGHVRRAIAAFPLPGVARAIFDRYFRPEGASPASSAIDGADEAHPHQRFPLSQLPGAKLSSHQEWLLILANFVEVHLARHDNASGAVGINYLHKIQFPILPSLYGAMLAGVDVVLMGAGIPGDIPNILDRLSRHEEAHTTLDVLDAGDEKFEQSFDPAARWEDATDLPLPAIHRPKFLAIVSSVVLAKALLKKAPGGIDGFVVEAPIAGGHNAPPRGTLQLSIKGEPIYGPRDDVDLSQMRDLGVPFWLAGGYASRERFNAAVAAGARGVQIGTAFAFCEESGLDPDLRHRFLASVLSGGATVFTDPSASPTSYPFKVAALSGTLSDPDVYANRPRLCDLGYLRRAYKKVDGSLGYRCPGEPVKDYVRKGGKAEDTVGRKCLCNSLLANIGLGQQRKTGCNDEGEGYVEPSLLTAGDDLACITPHISAARPTYHARDVIESLLPAI